MGPGVGNGKATAILFAREGASVLLVNRSEEHAVQVQEEIEREATGGVCSVCCADMTREADVEFMVQTAIERYGKIDVLHNNVGMGAPGTVVSVTEELWDSAMTANLKSVMWCCKYTIPQMIRSGGGSIINVSSVAALQGFRRGDVGFAPYSAAKAGLVGLSLSMAADYAHRGVRVNVLTVGMVNTPQLAKFGEEARERRRLAVPLQTEGTAWDVAWAAVYLASDESRWVTGAQLPIDGGQSSLRDFPG